MWTLNSVELGDILTTPPIYPPQNLWIPNKKNHTANNHHASTLQHAIYAHPHHKLIMERIGRISHFQPVLQAYPTHHSWIIMAHVS